MAFYVYILRCSDGSYYTGYTDNLERRLAAHQSGKIPGYTETRRPTELVFTEEFASRQDALARERQIKGWTREKKEALIDGDWGQLVRLAHDQGRLSRSASWFDKLTTNGSSHRTRSS